MMKEPFLDKKILNFAAVSGVNLGDQLIAEMISFLTSKPLSLCDTCGQFVDIGNRPRGKFGIARKSILSGKIIPSPLKKISKQVFLKKNYRELAKTYDEIWIGGGNLLFNKGCDNLEMCAKISKEFFKLEKPIKLISVGVGPFVNNPTGFLKKIFCATTRSTVRDEYSQQILHDYEIQSELLIDPVWYLHDVLVDGRKEFYQRPKKEQFFGVNVMKPDVLGLNIEYSKWVSTIAQNIMQLAKYSCLKPVLIISAFNNDPRVTNDVKQAIRENYSYETPIFYLPNIKDGSGNWEFFENLSFVLTHRMHVAICALSLGVPTVVYPWQQKIRGVLESVFNHLSEIMLLRNAMYSFGEVLELLNEQRQTRVFIAEQLGRSKEKYRFLYETF